MPDKPEQSSRPPRTHFFRQRFPESWRVKEYVPGPAPPPVPALTVWDLTCFLARWFRRLLALTVLALLLVGAWRAYFHVPLIPVQPSCPIIEGAGRSTGHRDLAGRPTRRFISAVAEAGWRNDIPLGVQGRQLFVPAAVWLSHDGIIAALFGRQTQSADGRQALFDRAAMRFFARLGGWVFVYDQAARRYRSFDLDTQALPKRFRCDVLQALAMEAWIVG